MYMAYPQIEITTAFTSYNFSTADFTIILDDVSVADSITLSLFYRRNTNVIGQGKYALRRALEWIRSYKPQFRVLTLYASPCPVQFKRRGIKKRDAQDKLNAYYTSLGMTAYHDPKVDDPGESNSFRGDIDQIIATIGQGGGKPINYVRTLCNDIGVSCKDASGRYLSQTKLLNMLQAQYAPQI